MTEFYLTYIHTALIKKTKHLLLLLFVVFFPLISTTHILHCVLDRPRMGSILKDWTSSPTSKSDRESVSEASILFLRKSSTHVKPYTTQTINLKTKKNGKRDNHGRSNEASHGRGIPTTWRLQNDDAGMRQHFRKKRNCNAQCAWLCHANGVAGHLHCCFCCKQLRDVLEFPFARSERRRSDLRWGLEGFGLWRRAVHGPSTKRKRSFEEHGPCRQVLHCPQRHFASPWKEAPWEAGVQPSPACRDHVLLWTHPRQQHAHGLAHWAELPRWRNASTGWSVQRIRRTVLVAITSHIENCTVWFWLNCSVRSWLDGEYIYRLTSEEEKKRRYYYWFPYLYHSYKIYERETK